MPTLKTLTSMVLLGTLAVLLAAGSVAAAPPSQGPDDGTITLAGAVASKISYQGRLTDANGSPLNSSVNLVFQLWNDATAGSQVWSNIVKNSVPVNDGLFSLELEVPQNAFNGQALWLRIQVNGQWLSPRQALLPAPYALSLKPGAGISGAIVPPASLLGISNSGGGIGLAARSEHIAVLGDGTTGLPMQFANPPWRVGVYGRGDSTGVEGSGEGSTGVGVRGVSSQYFGGFFSSGNDHLDLALGGAVGRINTDPANENSNLILSSNNDVEIRLDNDGGENGVFRISSSTAQVFSVDEQGKASTRVLQITGGSDLSERFGVRDTQAGLEPAPGMVVSIDPENPGELMVSRQAYDRRVAGILSGAGGVKPGMLMGQAGTAADGALPVALSGRVYCWTDTSNGPIQPGDLLTTSNVPGQAMKVTDHARAQGAILGKAMSSLDKGRGLILVLVTLQ